jgi:hypothetical protein
LLSLSAQAPLYRLLLRQASALQWAVLVLSASHQVSAQRPQPVFQQAVVLDLLQASELPLPSVLARLLLSERLMVLEPLRLRVSHQTLLSALQQVSVRQQLSLQRTLPQSALPQASELPLL